MEKEIDYTKTKRNTISGLEIFKDEINSATVIHIPHSSTHIPSFECMDVEQAKSEVQLLTDWATEKIFKIQNITQIIVPFSRVFCDVERLPDAQEAMFKKGRGFYYTHCDNGERFRKNNAQLKQKIFEEYYQPHHENLLQICQEKIDKHGFCYLIDAHSFSENPLQTEDNQDLNRPDICLGTDEYHTPVFWINQLKYHFESFGFSVETNHPYSGTIVPLPMYKRKNV